MLTFNIQTTGQATAWLILIAILIAIVAGLILWNDLRKGPAYKRTKKKKKPPVHFE